MIKCDCGKTFSTKGGFGNHKNFCEYHTDKKIIIKNKNKKSLSGKSSATTLKLDKVKYDLWKKNVSIKTKEAMQRPEVKAKVREAPQFKKGTVEYNDWKCKVSIETKKAMQRYGMSEKISIKTKEAMQRPEVKANMRFQYKTKEWNDNLLNKHGDINYNNMEKNKKTKLERYGNEYYNNLELIKQTNLKRYGAESWMQSKDNKCFHSKENHWNWQGGICNTNLYCSTEWKSIREEVYIRDEFTCQCCGTKNTTIVAHHIIPYKLSNSNNTNNLITLCNKCHPKIERKTTLLLKENKNVDINSIITMLRGNI